MILRWHDLRRFGDTCVQFVYNVVKGLRETVVHARPWCDGHHRRQPEPGAPPHVGAQLFVETLNYIDKRLYDDY